MEKKILMNQKKSYPKSDEKTFNEENNVELNTGYFFNHKLIQNAFWMLKYTKFMVNLSGCWTQ